MSDFEDRISRFLLKRRGFKFRFFWYFLTGRLQNIKLWRVLFFVLLWTVGFTALFGFDLYRCVLGVSSAVIVCALYIVICIIPYMVLNTPLSEILDKYGYGNEYLEAYEKKRIKNKPFDLTYAADFAEIYIETGQPEKAVEYLGAVTLPQNLKRSEFIKYISVYVKALLITGDLEKAVAVWEENGRYIDRAKTIPNYSTLVYKVYLTEIYIECVAAERGDEDRFLRAYELAEEFMRSDYFKNKMYLYDFDFILLYLLKRLGRTEELERRYPETRSTVDYKRLIFDFQREADLQRLEKAVNGQLPL